MPSWNIRVSMKKYRVDCKGHLIDERIVDTNEIS